MKNLYTLTVLVLSSLTLPSAFAAEAAASSPMWELYGSANTASVGIMKPDGRDSTTTITIGIGGGYFVMPQLEADLTAAYTHTSNNGGHTLSFLVGPTYNFSVDADDSPFVGAGIGETTTTPSSNTYSQFTWTAFAGKRFRLASHVTWAPQISYTSLAESSSSSSYGASTEWNFALIRLSILL